MFFGYIFIEFLQFFSNTHRVCIAKISFFNKNISQKSIYKIFREYINSLRRLTIGNYLKRILKINKGRRIFLRIKSEFGFEKRIFINQHPALGDSYFSGLYLKNLYKDTDCVVTTIGIGSTEVLRLFAIHNICILSQEDTNCLIAFCQFMQICDKKVTILHYQALEEYTGISWKFNGVRGLCFADLIESLVFPNLNFKDRKYPKFDSEDEPFFRKYGIKKNCSIILFPYSNTLFSPEEYFWEQIVKTYGSKYRMYTYINGKQMPIKNTLPISTNISKVNSLVEYAGMYIGIRSGMMDILSRAKCRKIVLYPSYGAESWIKGRIIDFWSLKNFGYAKDIEEYEWDKDFSIKL